MTAVSGPVEDHKQREDLGTRVSTQLSRYLLLIVLVLLTALFIAVRPETFGTIDNLRNVLSNEVIIVFLALAATLPLVVGEFDLSIAAVFTFAQVMVVGLVLKQGWSVETAVVGALAASIVVGVVNGVAVARFKIDAFIVTLASGSIITGLTLAYTGGESIFGNAPKALTRMARNDLAGIPLPVIYAAIATIVLALVLGRFPVGRRMYAIGSNRRAAALTGIRIERYVFSTFVVASLLAAVGGVILGSQIGAASSDSGSTLLIPAFAAAFLGATAFTPGRFNILGSVVAVYVLGVVETGLQQIGVALWVGPVFEGVMLFFALGLAAWTGRFRARRARRARLRELEERAERLAESGDHAGPGARTVESGTS